MFQDTWIGCVQVMCSTVLRCLLDANLHIIIIIIIIIITITVIIIILQSPTYENLQKTLLVNVLHLGRLGRHYTAICTKQDCIGTRLMIE